MSYGALLALHLLAAIAFAGTVFFEVVMLHTVRKHTPRETMRVVERAVGDRATTVMPWVLLTLFGAGAGLAWEHSATQAEPLASSFGLLLAVKILLALSVLGHFATAMVWRRRGVLRGTRSRGLHWSVFCHILAIVLLAKAMFYVTW
ncbi:CopD family copper resistance protein [Acidovorax sp. SDU_ACID1]|uniref:CopD family copper resistance protein n=1 Tax=Acidovorax sp. SDU_ACID1 TaxID=3136632 RepID=UPI003873784A